MTSFYQATIPLVAAHAGGARLAARGAKPRTLCRAFARHSSSAPHGSHSHTLLSQL